MKDVSGLRANLAYPPLSLYFAGLTMLFTVTSVLLRRAIIHDGFDLMDGLILGCILSGLVVGAAAMARWRLHRALGTSLSPQEQLKLNWHVEHLQLPQDARLRSIFPAYIRYFTTLNRHSRRYIPLFLGGLVIMAAILYTRTDQALWLLSGGIFILLMLVGLHGTHRMLRKLDQITPRLETKPSVRRPTEAYTPMPQTVIRPSRPVHLQF